MKLFILAIGFFTRLPVSKIEYTDERYRKAVKLAPLVGLVIGAILVLIQLLTVALDVPAFIRGALILCAYIVLTGGLHFDGLADTCDGVFSGRTREKSLEIMKDSRIGVFGTLGIFMTGLFYFAMFSEAPAAVILVFPVCGRACCLISASLAPYARADGMGKATSLEGGPQSVTAAAISIIGASFLIVPLLAFIFLLGTGYSAMSVVLAGDAFLIPVVCSLIAAGAAVLATACMTFYFRRKLGGVTGDTFGAVIEVSSIVYLLVSIVLFRGFLL